MIIDCINGFLEAFTASGGFAPLKDEALQTSWHCLGSLPLILIHQSYVWGTRRRAISKRNNSWRPSSHAGERLGGIAGGQSGAGCRIVFNKRSRQKGDALECQKKGHLGGYDFLLPSGCGSTLGAGIWHQSLRTALCFIRPP